MNTINITEINFAEICWGDYVLDGRIVPYETKFKPIFPTIDEESDDERDDVDILIDEMFRYY